MTGPLITNGSSRYPWNGMIVGDSFTVPLAGQRNTQNRNDMARVRLTTAAAYITERYRARFKITTDRENGVARCRRVA